MRPLRCDPRRHETYPPQNVPPLPPSHRSHLNPVPRQPRPLQILSLKSLQPSSVEEAQNRVPPKPQTQSHQNPRCKPETEIGTHLQKTFEQPPPRVRSYSAIPVRQRRWRGPKASLEPPPDEESDRAKSRRLCLGFLSELFFLPTNPIEGSRYSGSTDILAPGMESRIVSADTLKALPPNQLGEIWVRGPNIMQVDRIYINKVGYTYAGDLGYFDEEGRLYVVDRLKELIKCYGYQVTPTELEGLLLTHPEILDAVVIPYPDAKAGEVPTAYVVREPNSLLTEQDILKFVEKLVKQGSKRSSFLAFLVAPFKRLWSITFVTSVPKSASGKILRRELIQKVRSNI
ncbi:putative AMP-dependent synthetase/ligase, AMP-binding enzyme domain-containing protein [Rosa chinensis]|uniref:Putative AMP-dependent synthetase/ligase, AMP-binding enzyme domain-containing protein n=1 Tax=Rosa chinensis TaxID=74649 RepID=A0A2P6PCD1_ROSCH|nr:putative AMP-dependent synthetase/ligase, AMP-binding enzyme domain-containing protein [Rosa chinensis]